MNNTEKLLLKLGAIQTFLMAVYHFFIPHQFNWGKYMADESPTINWSLISLNNYFSFNLLVLSLVFMFFLSKKKDNIQTIVALSIIILLFWIFSTVYQIIDPMPLPERLNWLGFLLVGVAFLNVIIFAIPLRSLLKKR